MDALLKAIEIMGNQRKLADACGISEMAVSKWVKRGQVPIERCLDIERATGLQVTRYDLRPEIFGARPAA